MWVVREWLGVKLAVQNLQKETYFHENEYDERHIYVERRNRDNNNQDARNYNLRTHKNTIKQTFKGRLIFEDKIRHAIDEIYGRFKRIIPKS